MRTIADLVNREGIGPDEERVIREQLKGRGFSVDGIGKAMEWMDKAALSGTLLDTLGMLQPVSAYSRVDHALERASLHPRLLRAVDACRCRGWIGHDMAERLLEGLRTMDTRDWDDQEIEVFFAEVLGVSSPSLAGQSLAQILGRKTQTRYN